MGKAKKGKRTDKDDDFDSDAEVNDTIMDEPVKSKKSKEKKKKGDDVDDLADDLKDLKVEKSKGSKKEKKSKKKGGDSDDDMPAPKGKADSGPDSEDDAPKGKQKNRKNQPPKKGFAALSIESDNNESESEQPKSKAKGKKGKKADSDDEEEVKPSKGKNKKKDKKHVESDEEDSENDTRKAKAKGKKGKKAVDSDASDDEEVKVKAKNKSNAKKNKKRESDDESEDEIPKLKGKTKNKKGRKASESDDEFEVSAKPAKTMTPKAPKASFALLNMDDDVDQDDEAPSPPPSDNESEKTQSIDRSKSSKQSKAQESQKESKKGKKAKKKKQDSDEDIDKVLAELEMEYSGQKKADKKEEATEQPKEEDASSKGKKPKEVEQEQAAGAEDGEEGGTVKTAAQKKKEKKEREKQKKLAQKKAEATKKTDAPKEPAAAAAAAEKPVEKPEDDKKEASDGEGEGDEKKKKKKGAKEEPPAKEKTKGPGKKMIAAMQEALKKAKEEEERIKREAEEKLRQEEELERLRLEKLQKEQEKKEKKKLKEKQRKEKLKAEGKLLTAKQKQDKARAQAMLEALKAQGLDLPEAGQKAPRPGTRIRPNKLKQQTSAEAKEEAKKPEEEAKTEQVQVEIVDKQEKPEAKKEEEEDSVKDAWDAETSEEEAEEDKSEETQKESTSENAKKGSKAATDKESTPEDEDDSSDDSESESDGEGSDSDDDDDDDDEEDSDDDKKTDAERRREKVLQRIRSRREEAEKKRTTDDLRAAVVCVLGHVDTGKTKILDKLRRTNVQDSEAGGITQQIGATNVPIEAIQESTKLVKGFAEKVLKLPGLLIIDTPGHESFSNLRNRGSSLCDIAILVVDIMHGLEPQTIESIELLKKKKCPFVVALNKIDRLFDWVSMGRKDIRDIVAAQGQMTQQEFDKRSKEVILQFAEKVGLNAALFYENPDPRTYVSLVPTSAITGEGMGNLLALIVDACQGPLAKRLMYSEELQATVLEVKALPGLGTTIDCILVNGMLREGDTMIVAGTEGPIVTQIRSLLMPQPLKELRVKNAYVEHREVKAAQGVKIAAKELEKAIAGLNLLIAHKPDEVEIMKEEIARELKQALSKIKLAERGVFVQASTLGALEALLEFLKESKIPYAGIRIGPVVKKDVMKASIMLEHDVVYATILAFDVKIERDAQELADSLGVKIFQADIIYHLFDRFTEYKDQLKQRKRDEFKHIAVFPCKLKVLPQFVFKSRDPIVMGVMVEAGIVKEGTPICVPSKEFVDLGVVTSIECNHKQVESARKGQEVCVKIEPIPGEAPKMYGRHFDEKDMLVSKISRQSIDACKDYFREDLAKSDWSLMVELKKLFQIL